MGIESIIESQYRKIQVKEESTGDNETLTLVSVRCNAFARSRMLSLLKYCEFEKVCSKIEIC